jgi:hypothetical protein
MQDLPRGADREWIAKAKKYIEYLQKKVLHEKEWLERLLAEVEQGAADRFHEEFNRDREEN